LITVADVLELEAWISRGIDDSERELRAARVRNRLFPEGLEAAEYARRRRLIDEARREIALRRAKDDPMPTAGEEDEIAGKEEPEAKAPERWGGLISPESPAYKRASLRDGTQARVDQMRTRSRGSPFDAEDRDVIRPVSSGSSRFRR
jgi:hypothetical protein